MMQQFITSLLNTEGKQRTAQSMLFNGSLILYGFAAVLFADKEYYLAIGAVVLGWLMVEAREFAKLYMKSLENNGRSSKSTK